MYYHLYTPLFMLELFQSHPWLVMTIIAISLGTSMFMITIQYYFSCFTFDKNIYTDDVITLSNAADDAVLLDVEMKPGEKVTVLLGYIEQVRDWFYRESKCQVFSELMLPMILTSKHMVMVKISHDHFIMNDVFVAAKKQSIFSPSTKILKILVLNIDGTIRKEE